MEPATPAIDKKIDYGEFEIKSENQIKNETDLYNIQIGKFKEHDYLVIKITPEKSKSLFYYILLSNLYELQQKSRFFLMFNSIDDLILKFKKIKYTIEEKNGELILKLNIEFLEETNVIDLIPKKKFNSTENVIKIFSNEINNLKATINQKDQEINNLKKSLEQQNQLQLNNNNLNQNILNLQANEQELNSQIYYWQNENKKLIETNMNLNTEINKARNKNNELEINSKQLNNSYIELNRQYKILKHDKSDLDIKYNQLKNSYDEINKKYEKLKTKNDFTADRSEILTSKDEFNFIADYIKINDPSFKFKNIKLLYRGSRDGDRTKTCHELRDNKKNVLIIIQTDDGIKFGGYSKIGFKVSNQPIYLIDNNCFLFSVSCKKIYPAIKNRNHISHINEVCGLCFTGSLCFFDNFMNTYDNCIYSDIQQYFNRLDEPYEMNGGKNKFKCVELEVFQFE